MGVTTTAIGQASQFLSINFVQSEVRATSRNKWTKSGWYNDATFDMTWKCLRYLHNLIGLPCRFWVDPPNHLDIFYDWRGNRCMWCMYPWLSDVQRQAQPHQPAGGLTLSSPPHNAILLDVEHTRPVIMRKTISLDSKHMRLNVCIKIVSSETKYYPKN